MSPPSEWQYVAAAYLVVFVFVLAWVAIIAAKLQRLQRQLGDLVERARDRGLLVEHRARGAQPQPAAAGLAVGEQVELGFLDAGGIAPARRVGADPVGADAPATGLVREAEPQAREGIRTTLEPGGIFR